jgi:hypothetical protein
MIKLFWIFSSLIWICSLIILIVALTNILPNNPFKDYRLVIGIGFLCITGLIKIIYNRLYK